MILYVGRIEPLKGIDTLIEAIAHIRGEGNGICLAVVGGETDIGQEFESAEMSRLKAVSTDYGLDDSVIFLGKRSQNSLPIITQLLKQ